MAEALAEEVVARLSNVLWIVDVNRQSLDRIVPDGRLRQMRAMFEAGGWHVSELKWGRKLQPSSTRVVARSSGSACKG